MGIKVLHMIDSGGLYGAENMLLGLVEEQLKSGLQPLILSAGTPHEGEKPLEAEARRRGLPILAYRMKAGLNLGGGLDILKLAHREGFDILHSHGYKFNILIGIFPRLIRRIPMLATLHGYVGAPRFSRLRLYDMVERFLLCRMDGVVFVSSSIRKRPLLKRMRLKREFVIHNGINIAEVLRQSVGNGVAALREIFPSYSEDCIYLGAIGRLSEEKGFDLLLDSFARLSTVHPGLRLAIIGEGPMRSMLEARIGELGLANKVRLPGFVNPASRLMKALNGVVISSYSEGLPMTLLEACVLEKPIVSTRVGSISEVLTDYPCAALVRPGDVEGLVRAIESLILSGEDRCLPLPEAFIERYSSATMAENYTSVYKGFILGG